MMDIQIQELIQKIDSCILASRQLPEQLAKLRLKLKRINGIGQNEARTLEKDLDRLEQAEQPFLSRLSR